jgi:hypothetical protein
LVNRNPGAPVEADLRRAVSTAYYALFRLLIHEATLQLVAIPALRPRVARAFDHKVMKAVCQEYASVPYNATGAYVTPAGQPFPQRIWDIATAFVALQAARHEADYNTGTTLTPVQADTDVMRAEAAFIDWTAVSGDPAAAVFLAELFCRGIPKR